jgi:hypothetical protein
MKASQSLRAALAYAERGWHVFPAPPGEKKSYKSATFSGGRPWGATADYKQIKRDFTNWSWPHANVGIVTGPKSGIFVVEADTLKGHAVDGIFELRKLERRHGRLPSTLIAESPSGSIHYYFNYPADVTIGNSTSKVAPGIDVRGEGGMVIAPPSVRADGKYRWLNENKIADAPEWLIELTADNAGKHTPNEQLSANDLNELTAAVDEINNNLDYDAWKKLGLALYGATGGDDYGYQLFDGFSKRWIGGKYDEADTRRAWKQITDRPPRRIGAGTIYHLATQANPKWRDLYEARVWTKLSSSMLRNKKTF